MPDAPAHVIVTPSPALWLDGWIRQQSWAAECEAMRVAAWCEDDPLQEDDK